MLPWPDGSGGRNIGFWNRIDLVGILPLMLTDFVTLGKMCSRADLLQGMDARIK